MGLAATSSKQLYLRSTSEVDGLLKDLKKTDQYKGVKSRAVREVAEQMELKLFGLSQGLSDDVARSAASSARQAASNQLRSRFQELDGRVSEIEKLLAQIVQHLRGQYPDPSIDPHGSTSEEQTFSEPTSQDERDRYGSTSSLDEGSLESPSEGSHNNLVNHDIDDGPSSDRHHPSVSTSSQDNRDRYGPLSSSEDAQGNGSTSDAE